MVEKTVRLLLTAGILLMIAGCIFGFIGQWIYAALVWAGAFGCILRQSVATGAFASGHLALRVAGS